MEQAQCWTRRRNRVTEHYVNFSWDCFICCVKQHHRHPCGEADWHVSAIALHPLRALISHPPFSLQTVQWLSDKGNLLLNCTSSWWPGFVLSPFLWPSAWNWPHCSEVLWLVRLQLCVICSPPPELHRDRRVKSKLCMSSPCSSNAIFLAWGMDSVSAIFSPWL